MGCPFVAKAARVARAGRRLIATGQTGVAAFRCCAELLGQIEVSHFVGAAKVLVPKLINESNRLSC